MRLFVTILIVAFTVAINAQDKLKVVVPQNICIESTPLAYGVLVDPSLRKDSIYPIVHVTLYDSKGQTLIRMQQHPESEISVSMLQLPSLVRSGSYVLTASILTSDLSEIVEESSQIVHVIGSGRGLYYQFPEKDSEPMPSDQTLVRRSEICVDTRANSGALGYVVSADVSLYPSQIQRAGENSQDLQYELAYRVKNSQLTSFPALFNSTSRLVHPIAKNGVVKVPNELYNRHVQYIDMENGPAVVMCRFEYPKPLWQASDLSEVQIEGEQLQSLRRKTEERELINRIFENQIAMAPAAQLSGWVTEADEEFDLSNYLAFESLELFFKEVAGSVRVRNKNEVVSIHLLNGDSKNWYSDSPVLLIDGVLQSSIDKLWDVPFEDCKSIRLYRRLNSIRRTFGPLGRNGVLEIVTKSPDASMLPVLAGVHPWQAYSVTNTSSGETTGVFRSLQCFEPITDSNFCYEHSDDIGTFIFHEVSLGGKSATSITVE